MTNYHIKAITLPSVAAKEAKEQRQKVLAAVRARRKIIYARFEKKMQLHAANDLARIG